MAKNYDLYSFRKSCTSISLNLIAMIRYATVRLKLQRKLKKTIIALLVDGLVPFPENVLEM